MKRIKALEKWMIILSKAWMKKYVYGGILTDIE